MKSKLNFLLIGVFLLSTLAITFVACDKEDDDDSDVNTIIGKWYLHEESEVWTYNGETYDWGWTYNPDLDVDFFGASIFEFSTNTLFFYKNYTGTSYDSDEISYETDGDMIILIETYSGEEYRDTLYYKFENDMLVLSNSYEYEDEYGEYKIYFKKYSGSIPPTSWTEALPDDDFEPDDTYESANMIEVGETTDLHTTTAGDEDWFKFNAQEGETYLIQVSGYVDGYLYLYDTDGTSLIAEDDDNDYGVDVNVSYWGNPVLLWDCSSTGSYYFRITGYDESDEGYYNVSLSISNLAKSNEELVRKTKRTNKIFVR